MADKLIRLRQTKIKNLNQVEKFFLNLGLEEIITNSKARTLKVNEKIGAKKPFKPKLYDLYNLYHLILNNKRTTVLEFGSGWSTLMIYLALSKLKNKYSSQITNLRRNNPFELFVLENEKKYLNITKSRIARFNKKLDIKTPAKINYIYSEAEMTTFNNYFATQYKKLPMCNPDFIYLDGPDQLKIKKKVNGLNVKHKDLMPMSCDCLKFEYFFNPGTIILCDGRKNNATFLKNNFNRKWKYFENHKYEFTTFLLKDNSIGRHNSLLLKFYNN